MAQGIPIVTTSVGCEGLDVRHREHLWIADTPADFAAGIAAVIKDPTLAGAMTANARALVERTYSWERIAGELEVALLGIARQPIESPCIDLLTDS
jgi:glycosyltransferase involved in cell wall biosynthesis